MSHCNLFSFYVKILNFNTYIYFFFFTLKIFKMSELHWSVTSGGRKMTIQRINISIAQVVTLSPYDSTSVNEIKIILKYPPNHSCDPTHTQHYLLIN
jgi:hypothetical protein